MKTKKELNALKSEVEALNAKLAALTEDELAQVLGGSDIERRTRFDNESSESIEWEQLIEG